MTWRSIVFNLKVPEEFGSNLIMHRIISGMQCSHFVPVTLRMCAATMLFAWHICPSSVSILRAHGNEYLYFVFGIIRSSCATFDQLRDTVGQLQVYSRTASGYSTREQ